MANTYESLGLKKERERVRKGGQEEERKTDRQIDRDTMVTVGTLSVCHWEILKSNRGPSQTQGSAMSHHVPAAET